jgi:hypothetical protein
MSVREQLDAYSLSLRDGEARAEYIKEQNTLLAVVGSLMGLRKRKTLKGRITSVDAQSALLTKHVVDKQCSNIDR